MVRFRVMGAARRINPVVIGVNNQTEMRPSYSVDLQPIGTNGEAVNSQGSQPGMMNGAITVICETEQDAFAFATGSIVKLVADTTAPAPAL